MSTKNQPVSDYVRRVQDESQKFSEDLLSENQRLRKVLEDLQFEMDNLREKASLAKQELSQLLAEQGESTEASWDTSDAENQHLLEEYESLRQQNANLVNLYASNFQLHGTLDRQEILAAIVEIIVNLVGSEELAIFDVNEEDSTLRLITSMGIDTARYQQIPIDSSAVAGVVKSGELFVSDQIGSGTEDGEGSTLVCIPLKVNDEVRWVISIFGLLEQKAGIEEIDRELFSLLATQAGMALYCAALHAERVAG